MVICGRCGVNLKQSVRETNGKSFRNCAESLFVTRNQASRDTSNTSDFGTQKT